MFTLLQQILKESNNYIEEAKDVDGSYVAVVPSKESKLQLKNLNKLLDTPNPLSRDKMHITVIYSKKKIEGFEPKGKMKEPIVASVTGLEVFNSRSDKNVLVLLIKSPELTRRHKYIMDKYEATYDFDEYKPHITLSYNIGDWEGYKDFSLKDIKEVIEDGEIEINEEYYEDLVLDWDKKHGDD